MASTKRTMIILWKWEELKQSENGTDEVAVFKSPDDKIIRINKKKELGGEECVLVKGIESIKNDDTFIFLHRGDNFSKEDVKPLLEEIEKQNSSNNLLKCFLFGEGRDFIYFSTQSEGLLDEEGDFFYEPEYPIYEVDRDGNKKIIRYEEVSVLEYDKQGDYKVSTSHFDRVWNYYKNEFVKKINELRIDYNSWFVELEDSRLNTKDYSSNEWRRKIFECDDVESKFLKLRMMSFLDLFSDHYFGNLGITNDEKKSFFKYEKDEETSYSFDDCNVNLKEHRNKHVGIFYEEIKALWLPIFDEGQEGDLFSLSIINDKLNNLLLNLKPNN